MPESLVLSPLQKALASLVLATKQPKDAFTRDATIHRFNYTYELCWKFIKRDLTEDLGSEQVTPLSRRDLFRLAADRNLIQDPSAWFGYHQARNETSHTYNEKAAEESYVVALKFLVSASELLVELERKHA